MNPVKASRFDKILREISPRLAVRRLAQRRKFDTMAGGYDGAVDTRFRHHKAYNTVFAGDEDRVLGAYDREKLRLELRDLRRNLGQAFGLLNRFADGVVGTGLVPSPYTSDSGWNRAAREWWQEYMKVCDYRRRLSGPEIQRLTVKARMAEGECGLIKLKNGQVQPIEAERIATPTKLSAQENKGIIQGFKLSKGGIPMGVYVCNRTTSGSIDKTNYQFVPMHAFIHPSVYERFDQVRGVPGLAGIINYLRDKGEFDAATLFKAKMDAWMGWGIYSDKDVQNRNMADRTATQTTTDNSIRVEKTDMGERWYLDQGDKILSLKSETPNATHENYTQNIDRLIAMAAGIPYEVFMLNLAKVSFSGGRMILMLAYQTWDIWGQWLAMDELQPWWNWRVGMAIRDGDLSPAPVDARGISEWYKVEWFPPPRSWADPKGEAAANRSELEVGTTSVSMIARGKGTTAKQIFREKADNIEDAIEQAARVQKKHPDADVTWRDIMNYGTPGAQRSADEEDASDRARKKEEDGDED